MRPVRSMKISPPFGALLLLALSPVAAKTLICASEDLSAAPLLLNPYLSGSGQLCFDVRDWSDYQGNDCAGNGGSIQWQTTAAAITPRGSEQRTVWFRVRNAVVTRERLAWAIESREGSGWKVMQRIAIDRIAGMGTGDRFSAHTDNPFRC